MTMRTVFRTTATLPDRTGKFRTSVLLASRSANGGGWSAEAKAAQIQSSQLPCAALDVSDDEYARLEANPHLRFGYVDAPGDVTSPFYPKAWEVAL